MDWVGFAGLGSTRRIGGVVVVVVVVDALAVPKKRWIVDGRGRAMGLRNRRGVEEAIASKMRCCFLLSATQKGSEVEIRQLP